MKARVNRAREQLAVGQSGGDVSEPDLDKWVPARTPASSPDQGTVKLSPVYGNSKRAVENAADDRYSKYPSKRKLVRNVGRVPTGQSAEVTADSVRSAIFEAKDRLDDALNLLDQKLALIEHERTLHWQARKKLEHDRLQLREDRMRFDDERQLVASLNAVNESLVKINVGGVRFETTRDTLTAIPDSMLAIMFSGRHSLKTDADGFIFIDRNPRYFEYVLDYLRGGGGTPVQFPADPTEAARIKEEFDYFLLSCDVAHLTKNTRVNVTLYDVVASNDILTLPGNTDAICDVKIVDGYVVTCGMDAHLRMWDLTTGHLVHDLDDHPASVSCMSCTSLTNVITGCHDGEVRLWDLKQGRLVRTLYRHTDWVRVTSCTVNHAASSGEDNTVRVWDLNLDSHVLSIPNTDPWNVCLHNNWVVCVTTSAIIKVWDLVTGRCVRDLHADGFIPRNLRLRDGLVAGSNAYGSVVHVWDVSTGEVVRSVRVADGKVRFALIDFDSAVLIGASIGLSVGSTIIVDQETGRITNLPAHKGAVFDANLQGLTLASGGVDGVVKVWGASYRGRPATRCSASH